jgi:hypothetical protein
MTDDVSKLPAWPVYTTRYLEWLQLERDAYRARMEALKDEVEQLRDEFVIGNPRYAEWLDILNALLAACERKEGER